jgi:GNAT superfamily N-acetyltransferase
VASVTVSLADGSPLRLRIGTPADQGDLLAGFEEFSDESRYRRFFTAKPHLSEPMVEHLVAVDRERHIAIAAFDPTRRSAAGGVDGAGVGVVRLIRHDASDDHAEFSIAVIDSFQHRGVGRMLMAAAAVVAERIGIRHLRGTVLAENRGMRALAVSLGGVAHVAPDDQGVLDYQIEVVPVVEQLDADLRAELAEIW